MIMFDLDGTLVDSARDLHASVNDMLQVLGEPARPLENVKVWIGNGIDRLIHRSLTNSVEGEVELPLFEKARNAFNQAYDRNNGVYATIYPGVIDTLNNLKNARIPLCCVTNKDERFTLSLLDRTGLADYFDLVVAGDTLENRKPHPQPLLYAAQQQSVNPADCVMVGDSMSDLKAGRASGFRVYCISYGYSQGVVFDQLPIASQPDGIIDDLTQLPFCQPD